MGEGGGIEVGIVELSSGDLVIIVSSVVEDALFKVITRSVKCMFISVVAEVTTAVLLVDRTKDMEELADAG